MSGLNLENLVFPKNYTNATTKMNYLVTKHGMQFVVVFKGKHVPLLIKRKIEPQRVTRFLININYPKTSDMTYNTLTIHLGYDIVKHKFNANHAYIEEINTNMTHSLSGSYIVDFAVTFLRFLGVSQVILFDAASLTLPSTTSKTGVCEVPLSLVSFIKRKITFYGKFGFVPVDDVQDWNFENSKDKRKQMCAMVSDVEQIEIRDLITGLQIINDTILKAHVTTKNYFIQYHYTNESGILETSEKITLSQKDMKKYSKLIKQLEKLGSKNTIKAVLLKETSCNTVEPIFKAIKILSMFDHMIGNSTVKSTFNENFHKLSHALHGKYKADLTKPYNNISFCSKL